MTNIFITGINGYISKSLKEYLSLKNDQFNIVNKSVRNCGIEHIKFDGVDVVVHSAAIVHKKESVDSESLYSKINVELSQQLAVRAKSQGVRQFIFFSTMAVYGGNGIISGNTELLPKTYYGKSKLAAEKLLLELEDENFKVSIIRPPMVYGPNCPGNYVLLSKLARRTYIFPEVSNKRSMIFIDNLTEFIFQIIKNNDSGIFHPQDPQLVNTSLMVKEIRQAHNKNIIFTKLGAYALKFLIGKNEIYNKVFGNLYYEESLSKYNDNVYQRVSFKEAIIKTENNKL